MGRSPTSTVYVGCPINYDAIDFGKFPKKNLKRSTPGDLDDPEILEKLVKTNFPGLTVAWDNNFDDETNYFLVFKLEYGDEYDFRYAFTYSLEDFQETLTMASSEEGIQLFNKALMTLNQEEKQIVVFSIPNCDYS
jgi:hypothetical protein